MPCTTEVKNFRRSYAIPWLVIPSKRSLRDQESGQAARSVAPFPEIRELGWGGAVQREESRTRDYCVAVQKSTAITPLRVPSTPHQTAPDHKTISVSPP